MHFSSCSRMTKYLNEFASREKFPSQHVIIEDKSSRYKERRVSATHNLLDEKCRSH